MLKGQAKTDYQREYMRKRRHMVLDPLITNRVRPIVRPKEISNILEASNFVKDNPPDYTDRFHRGDMWLDADGNPVYDEG